MPLISSKARKKVKQDAIKEAEAIFVKTRKDMAINGDYFPKTGENAPAKYNREAAKVEKQVVKTRLKNFDDEKTKGYSKSKKLFSKIFK